MKDKYDGATEVRVNKRGRLQVKNAQYNLPTANDLVYLDESPDYCLRNKTIGSFGREIKATPFFSSLPIEKKNHFPFVYQVLTAGRATGPRPVWTAAT